MSKQGPLTPSSEKKKKRSSVVLPASLQVLSKPPFDLTTNTVTIITDEAGFKEFKVDDLRSKTIAEVLTAISSAPDSPLSTQPNLTLHELFQIKKGVTTNPLDGTESVASVIDRWEKGEQSPLLTLKNPDDKKKLGVLGRGVAQVRTGMAVVQRGAGHLGQVLLGRGHRPTDIEKESIEELDMIAEKYCNSVQFAPGRLPEDYVYNLFKNENHETVKLLLNNYIQAKRAKTEENLQKTVYENYQKFINTSKEIENLEQDMVDLRNHLSEMNTTLRGLSSVNLHLHKTVQATKKDVKLVGNLLDNIHWILELPDELDILTSERLFEDAVERINDARKLVKENPELAIVEASIKEEFDHCIRKLSDTLVKDLQNPAIKKSESQKTIDLLQELGFVSRARDVFLQTRTTQIESNIAKLRYDGDTKLYINSLSQIVFRTISATCDDFRLSFQKPRMLSGFVVWAMKVLEMYLDKFITKVFKEEDFLLIGECVDTAKTFCAELEEKGLSLMFHLKQSFQTELINLIENFAKKIVTALNGQLAEEKWTVRDFEIEVPVRKMIWMTESGIFVYNVADKFSAVLPLINTESVAVVFSTLSSILEKYFFELSGHVDNANLINKQYLAIIANAGHLSNELLSKVIQQHKGTRIRQEQLPRLAREKTEDTKDLAGEELKLLQARLTALYVDIKESYLKNTSNDIVNTKLDWGNTKYDMGTVEEGSLAPSSKFIKLFDYLYRMAADVASTLGKDSVQDIISTVLERVLLGLTTGPFWGKENSRSESMFSPGGICQFVLDMKFIIEASGNFLTTKAQTEIRTSIERALVHYCLVTNTSPDKVLPEERWYKRAIRATIASSSTLKKMN